MIQVAFTFILKYILFENIFQYKCKCWGLNPPQKKILNKKDFSVFNIWICKILHNNLKPQIKMKCTYMFCKGFIKHKKLNYEVAFVNPYSFNLLCIATKKFACITLLLKLIFIYYLTFIIGQISFFPLIYFYVINNRKTFAKI